MFREDEYIALSALQHFVFCPRQCALIYTEQVWAENALTTLGRLEHERADSCTGTTNRNVCVERSVQLANHRLGIYGIADIVEYEQSPTGCTVIPVEYKHGRPKEHEADAIQLCAQALCLEEMHHCSIARGYLFYHTIRRRCEVVLDEPLRRTTRRAIEATRQLLASHEIPSAVRTDHCRSCSLYEQCLPPAAEMKAAAYNDSRFRHLLTEESLWDFCP